MPHDSRGNQINVGDEVLIRARVESVTANDTACNVSVQVIDQVPDTGMEYKPLITFNSRLLVLDSADAEKQVGG